MILGIDVSSYQPNVDYNLLYSKGVRFVIIKATQGTYLRDKTIDSHFQAAQKAGMMIGFYHWHDPSKWDASQADYYLSTVEQYKYHFTCLDVEQFWSDWSTWPRSPQVGFTPNRISESARTIANRLKEQTARPVVIYTRPTFIMDYASPMLEWINDFPVWYATYPFKAGGESLSWEEFALRLPDPTRTGPFFPTRFPAIKRTWLFWQFTGDKFTLPGCASALDVNYFNGDLPALHKFCGVVPEEEVQPALTVEQRLSRLENLVTSHGWSL